MTHSKMELAVIILNWNAAEDTINCIENLDTWSKIKPEIWVVDNNSTDGSRDQITQNCPHVNLVLNDENLGFAGGTNRGVEAVMKAGDATILFLNNDALIFEKDVINLLVTLQEYENIGLIAPLLFDDGEHAELISAGGKDPVKHHQTRIKQVSPGESVKIVENVSGAVVVIRTEVFREVGLLDEKYFFSTELPDLCMRAKRRGLLSAVDTRSRATHTVSRSASFRGTLYTYYIIRNRFLFMRNHYPYNLPLFSFWIFYSVVLSMKLWFGGKRPTARAVFLGLSDGLRGRFGGRNEQVLAFCAGKP